MKTDGELSGTNPIRAGKERIWYWDTVKFIMILLVVIGHFAERIMSFDDPAFLSVKLFIYSFHMPIFIFIFGLFFKEKDFLRKILFYVISGYLLKGLLCLSWWVITGKTSFRLFYDSGVPWFMFVLAWYTLIAWLFRKVDKRIILAISFVIPLITGYFRAVNDCFCFSRMFVFLPFFWLGTMIDPNDLLAAIRKYRKYLMIPSLCLILVWLAVSILKIQDVKILIHLFTGRNPFSSQTHGLGFLYRLLTYAISFLIGAAILIVVPQRKIPAVSYLGRNTVNVYFWHYTFILIILRFLNTEALMKSASGVILVLLIAVALTFVLSLDIFNFPLKNINQLIMNVKRKGLSH